MQELNEIRVTWQLAVVVCALAILPVAGVALASVLAEPGQRGGHGVTVVCGVVIAATLLLAALAILSRVSTLDGESERRGFYNQFGLGLLAMVLGSALAAASYFLGLFSGVAANWYYVPTGLYAVGLIAIGKAMVPADA